MVRAKECERVFPGTDVDPAGESQPGSSLEKDCGQKAGGFREGMVGLLKGSCVVNSMLEG